MARARDPEKRNAILEAAAEEIAETGLGAATAKIAARAGIATGTLFTYFATKEELFNELYLELKNEVYARIAAGFPHHASLERRAWHIWSTYLDWAIASPAKRKASVQLNVSDVITPETRLRTLPERRIVEATLDELESRGPLRELPSGFAAALMSSMQEAIMEFISHKPRRHKQLSEQAFQLLWRAVR